MMSQSGEFFRNLLKFLFLPGTLQKQKLKLAVFRLDELGDFCLFLPYAASLRRVFPEAHLTLIGNAAWMELARSMLDFDAYVPVRTREFMFDWNCRTALLKSLQQEHFSCTLNPRISRYLFLDDLMQLACRAPKNISFAYAPQQAYHWKIGLLQKLLNHLPHFQLVQHTKVHELENLRSFWQTAVPGGAVSTDYRRPVPLVRERPYVLLAPEAGKAFRSWPLENFLFVGHRIAGQTGLECILCGTTPGECGNLTDLRGRTTLTELASLIAGARLVIGNDSGPVHMAAVLGIPSIALVGGGGYGRFFPYPAHLPPGVVAPLTIHGELCGEGNCNWQCRRNPEPEELRHCVATIDREQVLASALTLLNR